LDSAQRLVDGLLEGFAFRLTSGSDELILRGTRVAGSFHLERKWNGSVIATQVTEERPVAVVVSPLTDSIATALILGQRAEVGSINVLELADQLEPVLDRWLVQDAEDGARWVRTQQGFMRFAYGASGEPLVVSRGTGRQQVEARLIEGSLTNYGGPGLPIQFIPPAAAQGPAVPVEPPR
jgi:hypothetical protein